MTDDIKLPSPKFLYFEEIGELHEPGDYAPSDCSALSLYTADQVREAVRLNAQAAPAAQQPLTDEHKAILKKCRNKASRWALEARIREAGVFGEIAQDLDYLCGQLGARHD